MRETGAEGSKAGNQKKSEAPEEGAPQTDKIGCKAVPPVKEKDQTIKSL